MSPLGSRLRYTAGRGRRQIWQAAQRIDPVRIRLPRDAPRGNVALLCVYRERNEDVVRRLLAQLPAGATARLWSLDRVPAALAGMTVGQGPGTRFALLNQLVSDVPSDMRDGALILADDDVRLVVGDVGRLVTTAENADLDVYQPAHTARSYANWQFVRRRRFTVFRRTHFVEQGPLVGLSAPAQDLLLPLPEDMGMGWGVEARWWAAAQRSGLALGVIDAVAMEHLAPTATTYRRQEQEAQLVTEVRRAGLRDIRDLHVVVDRAALWNRTGPTDGAQKPLR